ncbi:hypothetical protein DVJ80_15715 [Morganella morganii]|nr:hypothetical protein [Salmonella enterica subsp. enterica serovar Infantis]RDC66984.1 hypothetical protein DVJ80_15715 [Morganella morganii]
MTNTTPERGISPRPCLCRFEPPGTTHSDSEHLTVLWGFYSPFPCIFFNFISFSITSFSKFSISLTDFT